MSQKYSDYMHWAKIRQSARFNLATSGVAGFPIRELPFGELEINGPNSYGYLPLQQAIAKRYNVDPDCVVEAGGAGMACHLAMAAMLDPGDEVLIEHPVYPLLVEMAQYLGAKVRHFERIEESGYAVDPKAVERAMTPRTRLIVITNLHNPSSAFTSAATLREVASLAPLLVNEVYLDASDAATSFHQGPGFVTVSSLTKIYGLSGLRCGWILAEPELAWKMRRLNDLYASSAAHPAELLSVAAFAHLDAIRGRARKILEADRIALHEFLDRNECVTAPRTQFGTTSFLRLKNGGVDAFLERLRSEYETAAVPGRFFGMPGHIRIGMGVDHEMFREGLRRFSLALGA